MTIQAAFREVEDSLIATRKIREQQAAHDRQIQGQQRTLRLATLRYENGYSSYLEVLDAQRSLFNAELQQVQLQRARWVRWSIFTRLWAADGCRELGKAVITSS